MVNGLVKTVKVFPDSDSKIDYINPKLVKEMDLTLSEKKRKGALADGLPINVNTVIEQIELTLNRKKIKMKDVRVLDIKHDLPIGTRTLCECDFVIKWSKPIDDDKKMMTQCGEEQEIEIKCEIIENIADVWLEPDFDLELFKFNSPNTELSNSKISEHNMYEPPSAMRNELSHQFQMRLEKKDRTIKLSQDLCVLNKTARKVRKKNAYWIKMVSIIVHIIKAMRLEDENYEPFKYIIKNRFIDDTNIMKNVLLKQKSCAEYCRKVQRTVNELRFKKQLL
uniref:Mab-21 domain-containing protein n=1 Tax=Strongyloides venezuelensis TaxID=75913 RepID=A0A0K0G447_STRVS